MSISLSSINISGIYVGSTLINTVYLGTTAIYSGVVDTYAISGLSPTLVLDFAEDYYRTGGTASTFSDAVTHSRASSATMVDSSGALVTVGVDVPRLGNHVYNGSAWVNEGLLHESAAATNLVTYSQDFTDASWLKLATGTGVAPAVTGNHATAPSGTQTADRVIFDIAAGTTSSDVSRLFLEITDPASGLASISFYAKSTDGTSSYVVRFANGTATSTFTVTGEWQRFDLTSVNVSTNFQIRLDGDQGTAKYADLLLWGAQAEHAPTPTSYIPTAGATATRAAETLTVPIANVPYPVPVEVTGTELVTNGTFDTDTTGWSDTTSTGTGSISWNSGAMQLDSNTTSNRARGSQSFLTTVGATYVLQYDATNTHHVRVGTTENGSNNLSSLNQSSGSNVATFTASATTSWVTFEGFNSPGSEPNIDNVSIKEITPLAVSIQMEGTMTYADTSVSLESEFLYWYLNSSENIRMNLATITTRTGQLNFSQVAGGISDQSQGPQDSYAAGINVPFNIASRHGSTFINGAVDGVALTEDTTPVALPDLSATDMDIGSDFMGTIKLFRVWADTDGDIGDTGIAEASA